MREAPSETAVARLDIHPPTQLAVGRASAFVIGGYCYHPRESTRALAVRLGEVTQPVERTHLPRQDAFESLGDAPSPHAFRSGFVAMVDVAPAQAGSDVPVSLVLTLANGGEVVVEVGSVRLEELEPPSDAPAPSFPGAIGPRVAICMATFNPPAELLRRQLDSIRGQTHDNWVCVISDDCSRADEYEHLLAEIDGDPRFAVSRSPRRLGFYRNFERALSMAPADADFVTLCDQDDRWHDDKLERLLGAIAGDAQLAYSDARVVSPAGELLHDTYWIARRKNHTNFASLLLANSITGAASLFRRELLDDVLPFPSSLANPFHDHWLAIVALARGRIAYVPEPLYDYVQHEGAVIGHSQANRRPRPVRTQLLERLRNPGDGSRVVYYYNWYQQLLFAEVLRLRCWDRMTASQRGALRHVLSADSGVVGLTWLLGRRVRRLWGHDETLDRELFYAHALVRRRAVSIWSLGRRRPARLLPRDASIPPAPVHPGSA